MDADIVLGQNATAPILKATLNDENGDPVDLNGATVTIEISNEDESDGPRIEDVTIVDPDTGDVEYEWQAIDSAVPATYDVRIEALLASGKIMPWPSERCWKLLVTPKPGNG